MSPRSIITGRCHPHRLSPPADDRQGLDASRVADHIDPLVGDDRRGRRDRGQTTVLAVALVAIAVLAAIAIGQLGGATIDRARARTAADAAALAAVIDEAAGPGAGHPTAIDVAGRNGAIVEGYRVDGTSVEVRVRVGTAQATSRANRVVVER